MLVPCSICGNFKTRQPEKLFEKLEPYGTDVIVGYESTFHWYWLWDACEEKRLFVEFNG